MEFTEPLHSQAARSKLPTSPSYIYPAYSIPTTPSLLSRQNSMSRLHPSRSHPNVAFDLSLATSSSTHSPSPSFPPTNKHPSRRTHFHSDATQPRHHRRSKSYHPHEKASHPNRLSRPLTIGTGTRLPEDHDPDSSWLLRTASNLTLTRLEEKGQSWLAARDSTTSLSIQALETDADDEYAATTSNNTGVYSTRANSPEATRSRYQSARSSWTRLNKAKSVEQQRPLSRRNSFRNALHGMSTQTPSTETQTSEDAEGDISGPDFVNPADRAEIAAPPDAIPYDDAIDDEENVHDHIDEREMRRVVMGRVGGWVDWAVGWMDIRQDDHANDSDEDELEYASGRHSSAGSRRRSSHKDHGGRGSLGLDVDEVSRRLDRDNTHQQQVDKVDNVDMDVPPAPEGKEAGLVGDARWLLSLAGKIAL